MRSHWFRLLKVTKLWLITSENNPGWKALFNFCVDVMFIFVKFGCNQNTLLNSSLSLLAVPSSFETSLMRKSWKNSIPMWILYFSSGKKHQQKMFLNFLQEIEKNCCGGLVQKNFKNLINSNIFCATKNLNANITPAAGARCRPKQTGSSTLLITHNKGKHILFCICNSCWLNCKYQQPKNIIEIHQDNCLSILLR